MRGTSLVVALGAFAAASYFTPTVFGAEPQEIAPEVFSVEPESAADLESLVTPLPAAQRIYTHTYRAGQVTTRVEAVGEMGVADAPDQSNELLIYSNTGGTQILKFGVAHRRVADDVQSDAFDVCQLSRYAVRLNGGILNGTGEFSCTIGLFTHCPSPEGGGVLISGTEAVFAGLADDSAVFHDLFVDVADDSVSIPSHFWIRVECDTASAGWVGGEHPEVGFTKEDFYHPVTGCHSFLNAQFITGFYARIWAMEHLSYCPAQFVAYATTPPTLSSNSDVSNRTFADDFQTALAPTGESCILSAYEVAARGFAGSYTLHTDLRIPFTDFPIPGTEHVFHGRGDGRMEITRHSVDPALTIVVPATPLWMRWEVDSPHASAMFADGPAIGWTDPEYYTNPCFPFPWCPWIPPGLLTGTFYLRVLCIVGGETTGACCMQCENQTSASCRDEILAGECFTGRWAEHEKCADEPFDPPCGTGACKEGIVQWLVPASGTIVDARQPFDPDDPIVPQGVTALIARTPLNADDASCWTLCDTLGNPLDTEVILVEDNGDNTQTLHLEWPITPGAATIISYANSSGCAPAAGRFEFLPGDVNANGTVLASEDAGGFAGSCLSGQPGIVIERCDMDRSGELSSDDLIRLIDLMNGAGPFEPWLGKHVSSAPCE